MYRSIFLLIAFFGIGCSAPGFSKKEQQSVIDSVNHILRNYYNDISTKGLLAEFDYLDSSADFFWVPPGYSQAISFDSTARFIRQNAPLFRTISIKWENLRIIPLSKELASYTGKLKSEATDTAGNMNSIFLIETGVVVKRKSGWKLLNGQTAIVDERR